MHRFLWDDILSPAVTVNAISDIHHINSQLLFTVISWQSYSLLLQRVRTIIYGSLFTADTSGCDILSDVLFTGHSSPSTGRPADDCYRRVCCSYNADVDRLYPQVLWERGYGGRRRATSHGPPAKARVPVYRRNLFAESAVPKARQLPCYRGERRVWRLRGQVTDRECRGEEIRSISRAVKSALHVSSAVIQM